MKKFLLPIGILITAATVVSCNDTSTSADTTDSTNMMNGDANNNMMNSDTGNMMNNNMSSGMTYGANNVSDKDKEFLMEAAGGGMMEVEAGQVAQQTAANDRVKSFGTMMVQDHSNANTELKALAAAKNVTLPVTMPDKQRKMLDDLRKKSGAAFDNAYMHMMVDDHQEDVSNFQAIANNAQDADVKAFATKTVPTLRMHLDSARAINKMY